MQSEATSKGREGKPEQLYIPDGKRKGQQLLQTTPLSPIHQSMSQAIFAKGARLLAPDRLRGVGLSGRIGAALTSCRVRKQLQPPGNRDTELSLVPVPIG